MYGDPASGSVAEDAQSTCPLSPYGASKTAAQALLYSYHHPYGIDATVLRYFTVHGPAGRPDMSVLRFIRAIAEGEPIAVYGDGSQQKVTYLEERSSRNGGSPDPARVRNNQIRGLNAPLRSRISF